MITAREFLRRKVTLPTRMSSADLRALDANTRRLSLFSARTTLARYLEDVRGELDDLLSGKTNDATARMKLQAALDRYDYDPAVGFPGDDDQKIPPAESGSLRDLSSDKRLRLMLETNVRSANNYAFQQDQLEDDAVRAYPAWELVRFYTRAVPRGMQATKAGLVDAPEDGWEARWTKAGGNLVDGRMVALKTDPIWDRLGSSELFDDGLDQNYPPFWFNSGAGLRPVRRAEAVELGLLDANDRLQPTRKAFAADVLADADRATLGELSAAKADLLAAARRLREA